MSTLDRTEVADLLAECMADGVLDYERAAVIERQLARNRVAGALALLLVEIQDAEASATMEVAGPGASSGSV